MSLATSLPDPALTQALLDAIQEFIVMKDGEYLGMVHLHDCLREGLV